METIKVEREKIINEIVYQEAKKKIENMIDVFFPKEYIKEITIKTKTTHGERIEIIIKTEEL